MRSGELLIDGFLRGGPCDSSLPKDVIRSPLSGHVVGTAAEGSWADLDFALDAAHRAFLAWRTSQPQTRSALLHRFAERVEGNLADLAELLHLETGKPMPLAIRELERTVLTLRISSEAAENWINPAPLPASAVWHSTESSLQAQEWRSPRGVVLGFVPYNWPFNLLAHKLGPAIASGNSIVVKVSPLAPISSLTLCRIAHEVGTPPGLVNAWNGFDADASRAVSDSRVAMLSFTGSARVGWLLHGLAPSRPALLEHGGDAFAVVFPDADLESAAIKVARSAFAFGGQVCISTQHVLVHHSVQAMYTRHLLDAIPKVAELLSPMINEDAARRVESLIDDAKANGANCIFGGSRSKNWIEPTVLTQVGPGSRLYREEVFGPALDIAPFGSVDEAIERVEQSPYGLQLGLFCDDPETQRRFLLETRNGGVVLQDAPSNRIDPMPYGGEKQSGLGREGVRYAMEAMSILKSVISTRRFEG